MSLSSAKKASLNKFVYLNKLELINRGGFNVDCVQNLPAIKELHISMNAADFGKRLSARGVPTSVLNQIDKVKTFMLFYILFGRNSDMRAISQLSPNRAGHNPNIETKVDFSQRIVIKDKRQIENLLFNFLAKNDIQSIRASEKSYFINGYHNFVFTFPLVSILEASEFCGRTLEDIALKDLHITFHLILENYSSKARIRHFSPLETVLS